MNYHLHDQNGIYLRTVEINSAEALPENGTSIEPPDLAEGEMARWLGGVWEVITELPPLPIPVVSGDQINAERDRRTSAGTTVNVTGYGDIPLQGGERDQTNLLGLVTAAQVRLAGGDTTTLTKFRDADNVDHMLTPAQIIEMWSKGAAWISANYDASWALKAMDPIPADFADDSYWP